MRMPCLYHASQAPFLYVPPSARARPCRSTCLGVEDAERDEAPDLRGDGQDERDQVLENQKGSVDPSLKPSWTKGPITRGQMPVYFLRCVLFKLNNARKCLASHLICTFYRSWIEIFGAKISRIWGKTFWFLMKI